MTAGSAFTGVCSLLSVDREWEQKRNQILLRGSHSENLWFTGIPRIWIRPFSLETPSIEGV